MFIYIHKFIFCHQLGPWDTPFSSFPKCQKNALAKSHSRLKELEDGLRSGPTFTYNVSNFCSSTTGQTSRVSSAYTGDTNTAKYSLLIKLIVLS